MLWALSIGEVSTQINLKTLNTVDVESINITSSLIRIQEIVEVCVGVQVCEKFNDSCQAFEGYDPESARCVKGCIEKITLGQVKI